MCVEGRRSLKGENLLNLIIAHEPNGKKSISSSEWKIMKRGGAESQNKKKSRLHSPLAVLMVQTTCNATIKSRGRGKKKKKKQKKAFRRHDFKSRGDSAFMIN